MGKFGIQIDDEQEVMPQYSVQINKNSVELHDWQTRAIEYFFSHNTTALFEVTTGAGKTYCAIEIIKQIHKVDPTVNILIVVPKNVILETGWYKELYRSGYKLNEIGIFYGLGKEYGRVTITNMQSINRIELSYFQMVVFDEVHNYCTKRLFPYLEHPFKYRLGLSATLERMDDAHWKLLKTFEYNVFKYSPHQALREGILNPFNFYNIAVEMDSESYEEYQKFTSDLNAILQSGGGFARIMRMNSGLKFRMLAIMNKRKQLVNNYVRKFEVAKIICQKYPEEKTLVFNQFNAQTTKLYWHLLEVGINARVVHSDVKKEERDKTLMDFKKDKFMVLLATRVLDEGYNLPAISCAIIMAGDSTAKQTIQRMGRVLRKKEKESMLFQIYCKGTMEEDQAIVRAKLFKDLSTTYRDYTYELDKELVL